MFQIFFYLTNSIFYTKWKNDDTLLYAFGDPIESE